MVQSNNPLRKANRVRLTRRTLLKGAAVGAGAALISRAAGSSSVLAAGTGPSTSTPSYVVPSMPGVDLTAILTVGDMVNGYRMSGIPDGLGARAAGKNFTLVMHHEIPNTEGIVRAHGSKGAFVSQWSIDRATLKVLSGKDLVQSPNDVFLWDVGTNKYVKGTTAMSRLCSADLPAQSALRSGNLGTNDMLFLGGEETNEGRAWARIVDGFNAGQVWQLPRLGKISFENVVASPHTRDKTVVMAMDDGSLSTDPIAINNPCELYVYVGTKQDSGSPIELAGLTNGKLYALRVVRAGTYVKNESNDFGLGDVTTGYVKLARFELVELGNQGDVSMLSGAQLSADVISHNTTRFQRLEDGAWDPRPGNKNDFYVVTTADINSNSRLWRVRFDDISNPLLGGWIEILLTNTVGRMFDNITIDKRGRILIQEDTGNQPYVSKIRLYGIDTGTFVEVAQHDPALFVSGGPNFITQDEESSGIIDAEDILGPGWFLLDVQVHKTTTDAELVEGGQLVAMFVDPKIV